MKKFLIIALLLCSCADHDRAIALAKVQYNCNTVTIVESGGGGAEPWVKLNVCGKIRFYEYGRWNMDNDHSWRERK